MPHELNNLLEQLPRAQAGDRPRLARRLSSIADALAKGKPQDRNLDRIARELDASVGKRAQRAATVPKIAYDDELPITAEIERIKQTIASNQVVVVAGETGSGKSTQLPKILLDMGRGIDGLIGHTQPRRLAARSVASRVAEELAVPLGDAVGYKIRFADKTNPKAFIKLMTDGVLLAEATRDRRFDAYDTIIIDEAHERSLNIDFLLGHLKQVLPDRPDLRVVITSATIDTQRFAEHFADNKTGQPAPVIQVSGRTYPVEVRYRPPELDEDNEDDDQTLGVLRAVEELTAHGLGSGDILVFMPTERDIRETVGLLEDRLGRRGPAIDILPLYARLTNKEQQAIFTDRSRRKIVVSTNVAESSLTVPGIRYVIDTGTARVSRYSPNSKVQRLPIEAVSRASCDQRKGRCGRLGPGVCIRLYSEEDFQGRDEFNTPEIQRSNLASVILQITSLRFGAIERFPFIDPPRPSMVRDGYKTLHELGAIDDHYELTPMGRTLGRMPVDPRVARMVLAGLDEGVVQEVLVIAAALEVQDPRDRPIDQQFRADEAHKQWADERSDFLAYINLWRWYHGQQKKLSNSQLRKACRQNFLNYMRMREWVDVHRQLKRLADELPGNARSKSSDDRTLNNDRSDATHRSLLTGLLSNLATKGEGYEYVGSGGQKLHLWPGSALFKNKPKWVVAAELVETTRRYARTLGQVQPTMIEPLARHLIKLSHSDPQWNPDTGSAMCKEKVSLYGLVLVQARPVPFGKVNPAEARQLFIQFGLVAGEIRLDAPFFNRNRALIGRIEKLEAKVRKRGLLVDDQTQYEFYDRHLPRDVYDSALLKKWLKQALPEEAKRLEMTENDLLAQRVDAVTPERFPDQLAVEKAAFKLGYRFEPGDGEDGVTLTVPRQGLSQIDHRRLGWLVPGLIEQKLVGLVKTLPKELRKAVGPAPEAARRALVHMRFAEGDFEAAAAAAFSKVGGLNINPNDFDLSKLDPHLSINLRVVDEHGKVLTTGRDLAQVRRDVGASGQTSYAGMDEERWSQPGTQTWPFGTLPKSVETSRAGVALTGYPAIIDEGKHVLLRLVDSRPKARALTRHGLRRLYSFEVARDFKHRADHWLDIDTLRLHFAPHGSPADLREQLILLMTDRAFLFDGYKISDEEQFITRQRVGFQRLDEAEREVRKVVAAVLAGSQTVRLRLDQSKLPPGHYARADLRIQLNNLLGDGFLLQTPWHRLVSLPRYLAGIERRLSKLGSAGNDADIQGVKQVAPHWNQYAQRATLLRERGEHDPELENYRWLIEELRVSLFAQELGTAEKVSPQRLEKQWQKVIA